jgi:hypothetical protein
MSWHFSRALVEEYSQATCSVGKQSALLSLQPTPQAYLCKDRMTAFSRLSRFGMTFAPLTDGLGGELLTWYLGGFHVRTSARQGVAQELKGSAQDYGLKWPELSERYDPESSSWKTVHSLFQEDLHWSSVILPKWGMIVSGALFQHPTAARPISGTASGLWPTPQASDNRDRGNMSTPAIKRRIEKGKQVMLSMSVSEQNGRLNPVWVEWLMGWPLGWTDLKPLEMVRFQEWQQQHSGF